MTDHAKQCWTLLNTPALDITLGCCTAVRLSSWYHNEVLDNIVSVPVLQRNTAMHTRMTPQKKHPLGSRTNGLDT